jgi:PIN domain nuclease of toxin-antitoxin system
MSSFGLRLIQANIPETRVAIDDARKKAAGLAISDITLLELATLACKGRIRLDISLESFLPCVFKFLSLAKVPGTCASDRRCGGR